MLKAWNGVGLASDHSNEGATCDSLKNCGVDWKNCGTLHGLFDTGFPLAKIS